MTIDASNAYPLCWPDGWPRAPLRTDSRFEVEFAKARDELVRTLRLKGGRHVVISTNVPLRRDGLPYAGFLQPQDPGVAVYWDDRKHGPCVVACDAWRTVRENMRDVGVALEALRTLDRCGSSEVQRRAYAGYKRLPETTSDGDHWARLGIARGATADALKARWRELAREHHPDRPGGDAQLMAAINDAYKRALAEVPQ